MKVNTHRSGVFELQLGVAAQSLQPFLDRVEDAHSRFSSIPIMADVASMLEKEVIASSVFGTNTIEGGTLTEEETSAVIDGVKKVLDEKDRRIVNIKSAYDMAARFAEFCLSQGDARRGDFMAISLTESMIKDLHEVITDGLTHPHNIPGAYRDNKKGQLTKVGDAEHGGVYTAPKCRDDIELLVNAYLEWINSEEIIRLPPLLRAPLAHYYFERIHPFWDGNGRVGRVIEMLILKCAGYKYAHFALSKFYQENIDQYFTVFSMSRKAEEKKEQYPNTDFVEFFLSGMFSVINQLHDRANRMIAYVLYENALNSLYQRKGINQRQHTIVANLLPHGVEFSTSYLPVQPWYQSLYKALTTKTRQRDLKGLEAKNLIEISEDKKIRLLIP